MLAYLDIAREVILLAMLVAAAYGDLAHGKVWNWCTVPAILAGLWFAYIRGGWDEGQFNLAQSGLGLLTGAGIFGAFYLAGGLGAADVKLAAAIGALKGWYFTLAAIAYSSLVGGVLALAVLIWKGQLRRGLRDTRVAILHPGKLEKTLEAESPSRLTLPYCFAISVGTLWAWLRFEAKVF